MSDMKYVMDNGFFVLSLLLMGLVALLGCMLFPLLVGYLIVFYGVL